MFRRKKKKDLPAVAPSSSTGAPRSAAPANQPIELGTIHYCNLTPDGRHGDYEETLRVAKQQNKPIFANFVEWSG